jgi:putative membrane-bound dehydrogenase-like protein
MCASRLAVVYCWLLLAMVGEERSSGEFPQPYNTEQDAQAAPLPAAVAAERFELPAGFHAQVFAAEPDVQNPIASAWDSRGRLWIGENYTYAEHSQQFALDLYDRVLVFEDIDGDGQSDRRTVFLDTVQRLTSIEVGHGGVWLMCPPQLLFVPDGDHDDRPDGPAQVVLDGFDVPRENYHNFANGLRWGPDGWLYGRCGGSCPGRIGRPDTPDNRRHELAGGMWRYHPIRQSVEVLNAGTTNPWGHDWNELGEGFFVNTVNGHLWHLIPGSHLVRPFLLDPNPHVYQWIDQHADHWHFDTGQTWQASRDGVANAFGGGHAHSGAMVYLGDNWPDEYRGRLMTLNFHGRRVNQEILASEASGYVGRHGDDICLSEDAWFRGIDLSYGPDGAVYVLDWSDTGECHESTGVHRTSGRVFRIYFGENPRKSFDDLRQSSDLELVSLQHVKNEWLARQARLLLAERSASLADRNATGKWLIDAFRSATDPALQVRLLLCQYAIGAVDDRWLDELTDHPTDAVRSWAIRLRTDTWPLDRIDGSRDLSTGEAARVERAANEQLDGLVRMAQHDPSPRVRLSLASTLQRLPIRQRTQLAMALVSHEQDRSDHNLPLMVWYGLMPLADLDANALVDVASVCQWDLTLRLIARRVAEMIEADGAPLNRLLTLAADSRLSTAPVDVLLGVRDALRGWRTAPQPATWNQFRQAVALRTNRSTNPELRELIRELSAVFGDGRALDEIRQIALDSQAPLHARQAALRTLIRSQPPELRSICERLVSVPHLNVTAAGGLAKMDDPAVAKLLIRRYRRFGLSDRPQVISILVSRPAFAKGLISAIAEGTIPREDVSAFQIKQLLSLGDPELAAQVLESWGMVRESSNANQQRIAELKAWLGGEPATSDELSRGRALFARHCSNCHRLYGEGDAVGPDLTGSGRHDLDYVLQNIVDPSAVVDANYRMTIVTTKDGRLIKGLISAQTDRTITLQTPTESTTLERTEAESIEQTSLSPMPDGLLDQLSKRQIRELIAYLRHPVQVPLPE